MTACVFCAIVGGAAPASMVYEDDDTVAFLDRFPVNVGHTLVVPRTHVSDLATCPERLAGRLMEVSTRLAPHIVSRVGGSGFNVWTANGRTAGQEVFHLHLHILPRFPDDAFGLQFPKGYPREVPRAQLDEIARTIRSSG